eukprot:s248_g19.t1
MPGTVASPHWFSETFGFAEEAFDRTREKFNFADGVLESKVNGRSFHVGSFELVSVAELRARLGGLDGSLGGLTFSNVCGNAQTLHRDVGNQGAVFQGCCWLHLDIVAVPWTMFFFHRMLSLATMMVNEQEQLTLCDFILPKEQRDRQRERSRCIAERVVNETRSAASVREVEEGAVGARAPVQVQ